MPADKIPTAVPQALRARIADALSDLPLHRREQFVLRAQRWWADLREAVGELYPDPDEVAGRALLAAVRAFADRPDDLHALDARRVLEPDWFEQPAMVGYAAYAERFAGADAGLAGVAERVEHLRRLGVTYLHLRPLLKPRPAPDDDGYAVADHRAVRTELGTADDLRALTTRLREAGICVGTHLTLGYVAREHAWATAARAGDRHYRKYFHIYPDRTEPDEFEATLTAVSQGFAPSAFTYDEELDGWVWTTFHDYEWDLAWDNPDVLIELAEVSCYLANLGVEVVQLDALGFLWKRLGTTCQNQPEVHSIVQALRTVVRIACPAVIFLAEPIVRPDDAPALLGTGSHFGKLSDLAYHNALMVHIWSMLASRDARLAARALARIPAIPASSTWVTYVRNHDDIAWAIEDRDAGAVGVTGHGHRGFLSDFYSGDFAGSFADGLVFRYNPFTGDRRISGTTASLVGLGEAEATANDSEIDLAVRRVLLAYAIVMGFGGIPMICVGRRDRRPQRCTLGRRSRSCRRQPVGAPAAPRLAAGGADRELHGRAGALAGATDLGGPASAGTRAREPAEPARPVCLTRGGDSGLRRVRRGATQSGGHAAVPAQRDGAGSLGALVVDPAAGARAHFDARPSGDGSHPHRRRSDAWFIPVDVVDAAQGMTGWEDGSPR